jgi:RNA polymerase sigma-70 factor (ECF subfamily)
MERCDSARQLSVSECTEGNIVKQTERIWHEYHAKLKTFLRSRVSEDVVDDLLQDIFIKIHARIDSLKEHTRLESWLYRITRNTIVDHYRSRRTLGQLPDWVESPQPEEEEDIRRDLSSCLEPMIGELPEKYRLAIQLSEIEGKTQKEVAEREGISLSGAKSRVQRGRALLKTMLYDCCRIEINRENQVVSYEKKDKNCTSC